MQLKIILDITQNIYLTYRPIYQTFTTCKVQRRPECNDNDVGTPYSPEN